MTLKSQVKNGAIAGISFNVGGGKHLIHKKTGEPIHLVREPTGEVLRWNCEECGDEHQEPVYRLRPDRRYNPKNIVEKVFPPTKHFVPLGEANDDGKS
jgi:hypothetical protein